MNRVETHPRIPDFQNPFRFSRMAATFAVIAASSAVTGVVVDALDNDTSKQPTPPDPVVMTAPKPPIDLPAAVQARMGSVVKVFRYAENNKIESEGSAVKVGPTAVLTAGHMMTDKAVKPGVYCPPATLQSNRDTGLGEMTGISRWSGQRDLSGVGPDLAVGEVTNNFETFSALPVAKLARTAPKVGSLTYFVNYESNDKNIERYPNRTLAQNHTELDRNGIKNYATPAMYAGVVLGQRGPFLEIATGLHGYNAGKRNHTENSFGGGSGGPVFNEQGVVEGLLVSIAASADNTAADIARDYGVQLPLPAQRYVAISYVQRTSPQIVGAYGRMLGNTTDCTGV